MPSSYYSKHRPVVQQYGAHMDRLLERQEHMCLYCLLPFGAAIWHKGNTTVQTPALDHFVPWSYAQEHDGANMVASCQLCNNIKSNKMFDTLAEAQRHVMTRRGAKNYLLVFVPSVASTADPVTWSKEFVRYLTGNN